MTRCVEGLRFMLPAALLLAACSGPAPRQQPLRSAVAPVAAPRVQAAVDPAKGDPQQRFQQALQLMKQHQPQEAEAAFERLAQDFPQYAGPLADLGVLQAQARRYDQAIASFNAAVAADDRNAFAWGWLGVLYRERGDYARAEQAYRKTLALRPDDAAAHLNLGILYELYLHRPAEALAQYREYRRSAGDQLVVEVWIRELEARDPMAGVVAVNGATR